MAPASSSSRALLGVLFALHLLASPVIAQSCYYPNGDLSTVDAPCSADGGTCCAVGWECLSNGLCYYEAMDYYERRTCTDRNWGDDCPKFCTTGPSIVGNEAIQQCSDGHWCCDADRHQSVEFCCDSDNSSLVIDVPDGRQIGFISSLLPPSSTSPSSRSSSEATSSTIVSTTSSPLTSSTPTPTTIINIATTSDAAGIATVITSIVTSISQPTSTLAVSETSSQPSSGPDTLTIAIAVVVPVVVLSLLALAYILYRRHQRNKPAQLALAPPEMANMYRDPDDTPELGGDFPQPVGNRTDHDDTDKTSRKSELYGSAVPMPNRYSLHQHSPAISSITNSNGTTTNRNSAATDPPLYSPVSAIQQQQQHSPPFGSVGGPPGTLPQVQEEQAHELWGGDWPGQRMYHPPTPPPAQEPPKTLQPGFQAYRPPPPWQREDGLDGLGEGKQGGGFGGKGEDGKVGEVAEVRVRDL